MHPKTTRQQNAQRSSSEQQAAAERKQASSQRVQTRASMSTEYQERFLPPYCHTTVISTSMQKDPYHPLKATRTDVPTFRSYYVTHKWIKNPPKAPQAATVPKGQPRCSSAPQNLLRFGENQMASKVEDYTSVYKNDFQAWKANKRQPFKLSNSLKVNQGLVIPNSASKEGRSPRDSSQAAAKPAPQVREPQAFASITSYRSDYVTHPVQPRVRREKPVYQPIKSLPSEPEGPSKPKVAWEINQAVFDGASDFFKQFKTWSFETKFQGQGKAKAKESASAEDHNKFLSTTHADYTAHRCERTKPILPSMQSSEKSKEPLQATTTMKEDYKAWAVPRRLPIVPTEKPDGSKKTPFSLCTEEPDASCTNSKPLNRQPKAKETPVCSSSSSATQNSQSPADNSTFSGFECISNENEESRSYWSTSVDRRVTWPDGNTCEELPEGHHIISCMVSSRN